MQVKVDDGTRQRLKPVAGPVKPEVRAVVRAKIARAAGVTIESTADRGAFRTAKNTKA